MQELVSTRSNPMIDPALHIWGWEIPVYLFLGGLVAGMMIISGYFLFRGRQREMDCACLQLPLLSIVLLSVGMVALFLDLEHKLYAWRMYATFQPASPMSWGSWILLLVYPALAANMLIRPPALLARLAPVRAASERIGRSARLIKTIGVVNMVVGGMLGVYTGILLSALSARPLWNSSILGLLFLVSGLSTAAAFVHMVARNRTERELLAKADNAFLTVELFLIGLFIVGLVTSTAVHIQAARLILSGPYAPAFWVFVVGLGIVIPLLIQSLAVSHRVRHTPIAPVLVILGGLILRFVLVAAGQESHWTRAALLE